MSHLVREEHPWWEVLCSDPWFDHRFLVGQCGLFCRGQFVVTLLFPLIPQNLPKRSFIYFKKLLSKEVATNTKLGRPLRQRIIDACMANQRSLLGEGYCSVSFFPVTFCLGLRSLKGLWAFKSSSGSHWPLGQTQHGRPQRKLRKKREIHIFYNDLKQAFFDISKNSRPKKLKPKIRKTQANHSKTQ